MNCQKKYKIKKISSILISLIVISLLLIAFSINTYAGPGDPDVITTYPWGSDTNPDPDAKAFLEDTGAYPSQGSKTVYTNPVKKNVLAYYWKTHRIFSETALTQSTLTSKGADLTSLDKDPVGFVYGDDLYIMWANGSRFRGDGSSKTFTSTNYYIHQNSTDPNFKDGYSFANASKVSRSTSSKYWGDINEMGEYKIVADVEHSSKYGTIGARYETNSQGQRELAVSEVIVSSSEVVPGQNVNYWYYGIRLPYSEAQRLSGGQSLTKLFISHEVQRKRKKYRYG